MHSVDFGKMTAKGASRSHLDASDRLHGAGRLRQRRVASGFAAILSWVGRVRCWLVIGVATCYQKLSIDVSKI